MSPQAVEELPSHFFNFEAANLADPEQYDLVRAVFVHPKIYPAISDDFSPAPLNFEPARHPSLLYLIARDYAELLGVWMLAPQNAISCEVHTALLPTAWGVRAGKAAKAAIEWVWENTGCQRLWTAVPAYNRSAILFARRAGFEQFGINKRCFQKGGKLYDQILLGTSRPQETK